jgi:hypothetical protein
MLIDGHIHFDSVHNYEKLMADMKRFGAEQFCILVIERINSDSNSFRQAEGIWLKLQEPDRAFLFGGLDYSGFTDNEKRQPKVPLVDQVQMMIDAGFDGLKMLTGKPNVRHALDHPLDGPAFVPMLNKLEQTQFPVLWHVGDPPEFWDKNAVPQWAREKGWWYESDIPPKAQIDREIAAVLMAHPRLNLILPHFFFLSDRLEDAAKLLQTHPNVYIDLAPGVEMLHNFTKNRTAAREFFIRFADRIIFGTDIGMANHTTSPERGGMVRRFLETDDVFPVPEDPAMTPDDRPDLHGIKLPADAFAKITSINFHRFVGRKKPRPFNHAKLREMVLTLGEDIKRRGGDDSVIGLILKQLR